MDSSISVCKGGKFGRWAVGEGGTIPFKEIFTTALQLHLTLVWVKPVSMSFKIFCFMFVNWLEQFLTPDIF